MLSRFIFAWGASLAIAATSLTPASAAAIGEALELTGSIGGSSHATHVVGARLYRGEGVHLTIHDVSIPATPVVLGRLRLPGVVRGIDVAGALAFVAAETSGVHILDVTNSLAPALLASFDTPGTALDVKFSGGFLYVADGEGGFVILNVTSPLSPVSVRTFATPGRAFGVALGPNIAIVADEAGGLRTYGIIDPTMPFVSFPIATADLAYDVEIVGLNALVAVGASGLEILDFTDLINPVQLSLTDTPGTAFRLDVSANQAVIADQAGGVRIIDVTNPASPGAPVSVATPGDAVGVSIGGSIVYVAALEAGLQVIDTSIPAIVGSYEPPADSRFVATVGTTAYVADGARGLKILDVTDPANPILVGRLATTGEVKDIAVEGSFAYLAAASGGFQVVDVSAPSAPSLVATLGTPAASVAVSGSWAVVTRDTLSVAELRTIDVTNPAAPIVRGILTSGVTGQWLGVELEGPLAYVADPNFGLRIVNVQDPMFPTVIGSFATPGNATGVALDAGRAYVADRAGGLRIVDVADPFAPAAVSAFNTAGSALGVAVSGERAFVADDEAGLQLIDLKTEAFPSLLDTFDTPGLARGVSLAGPLAYLADGDGGVAIFARRILPVAPTIANPGDVIIGDLIASTLSATGSNEFVFPDAFDLKALSFDADTLDSDIKWSFTGGSGKILINGVGPLDPMLMGMDDPTDPRASARIDSLELDPSEIDGDPFTVTFRNADLSPIGGPNVDPIVPGILPAETRTITLFASDCTTFSSRMLVVYTANETSDSLSGGGFIPETSNDFTVEGDVGGLWLGGVTLGSGATAVNSSGLCMTVPLTGDNIVLWVSPDRYVELVDNTVYRLRVRVSTTQSAVDAIPLWNVLYDNFNSSGFGNNYGGETWFLDVDGDAQGIGRAGGRTEYTVFVAPNALATPQWRGVIDPGSSALAPAADPNNDLRVIFRVLDIGSAPISANADLGTICVESIEVDSILLGLLPAGLTVYNTPISSTTHFAETFAQIGVGSVPVIDDATNTASYALNTIVDRKTLGPFDPTFPDHNTRLYPVLWEADTVYRARMRVRSNVDLDGLGPGQGTTEGNNPVDAITITFDTTNSELGQLHWTTRGSPGNMFRAASPRLPASVGGQPQTYTAFFYSQNATASIVPNANRLRAMGDFANNIALFGPSGGDAFTVESLEVDRIVLP